MTAPDHLLIASVSGLRGLVGKGLDPEVAAHEVAAALQPRGAREAEQRQGQERATRRHVSESLFS